ncbi:MAG: exodeoxyribonuclease V subunit alpha [Marinobacter sp.]|nr:exodeoxyribonuclease V subunit alpha [Marinobacter sp.]
MKQPMDVSHLDQALAEHLTHFYGCDEPWFRHTLMATSQSLQQGHACLHLARWSGQPVNDGSEQPFVMPVLPEWLDRLSKLPLRPEDHTPLVFEHQRLYLRRYWQFETELAAALKQRLQSLAVPDVSRSREMLDTLFPRAPEQTEPDWQKVAAANALFQAFSVVAGGPGTGKTYTVTRLLACLIDCLGQGQPERLVVRMAAPTGKAAQRLAESVSLAKVQLHDLVPRPVLDAIPDQGSTLHRLLGVIPHSLQFRHHQDHPLALDILVVDEVSMVDLPMMARLFRALPAQCRVILLGDANQLPSVAAGSVLADLAGGAHPGYSEGRIAQLASLGIHLEQSAAGLGDHLSLLRRSRRFDGEGGIGRLANAVLNGAAVESMAILHSGLADLHWIEDDRFSSVLANWVEAYYRPIPQFEDVPAAFEALAQFRILSPVRNGPRGVDAINRMVVARVNPTGKSFFRGQPIMITRNQYELGLYNGDIGLIWPDDQGQLMAWFPEGEDFRPMAPGRLPEHETVYAMTIHKTQGSEFTRVAMVLPESPHPMLSRELLYTGMTRAKTYLEICGSETVWCGGVEQQVLRHSGLALRLASG